MSRAFLSRRIDEESALYTDATVQRRPVLIILDHCLMPLKTVTLANGNSHSKILVIDASGSPNALQPLFGSDVSTIINKKDYC